MTFESNLDAFLAQNRISQETWAAGGLSWACLQAIAADHETNLSHLKRTAEFFAGVIQAIPDVHSVRWRVKDSAHLLEKIIRKCADGSDKYKAIAPDTYFDVVTDLVGVRALHLFKEDCFSIDAALRQHWIPMEAPFAFIREGDQSELSKRLAVHGFELKTHAAGYRSIHYIFATQPRLRKVAVEVQVRTIFEEGWSEIDHNVRYPNFSNDPTVAYFLTIFNRLAGSADEMGGFVRQLAHTLDDFQQRLADATDANEKTLAQMEATVAAYEKSRQQDTESQALIAKLQADIVELRKTSSLEQHAKNAGRLFALPSDIMESLSSSSIQRRMIRDMELTRSLSDDMKAIEAERNARLSAGLTSIEQSLHAKRLTEVAGIDALQAAELDRVRRLTRDAGL